MRPERMNRRLEELESKHAAANERTLVHVRRTAVGIDADSGERTSGPVHEYWVTIEPDGTTTRHEQRPEDAG